MDLQVQNQKTIMVLHAKELKGKEDVAPSWYYLHKGLLKIYQFRWTLPAVETLINP